MIAVVIIDYGCDCDFVAVAVIVMVPLAPPDLQTINCFAFSMIDCSDLVSKIENENVTSSSADESLTPVSSEVKLRC